MGNEFHTKGEQKVENYVKKQNCKIKVKVFSNQNHVFHFLLNSYI